MTPNIRLIKFEQTKSQFPLFTLLNKYANAAWTTHTTQVRLLPLLFSYSSHPPQCMKKRRDVSKCPPPLQMGNPTKAQTFARMRRVGVEKVSLLTFFFLLKAVLQVTTTTRPHNPCATNQCGRAPAWQRGRRPCSPRSDDNDDAPTACASNNNDAAQEHPRGQR